MNYRPEDKWTPEQDKTARDMADDGFSPAQIGAAIGRTRNAVLGYGKRRGISMAPRSTKARDRGWLSAAPARAAVLPLELGLSPARRHDRGAGDRRAVL